VETLIDRSTLEGLRAGLRGAAYAPGEEGYDEGRQAYNLNAHQHPAVVVMAAGASDVMVTPWAGVSVGSGASMASTPTACARPTW
jgi:hypothetical protein